MDTLTYQDLRRAVSGRAAAFRCITEYRPGGGMVGAGLKSAPTRTMC